ncbi:class 1 fructose-bisphosphatase [Campylobacter sp. FMV-PI01]|uniref:Fructose-1,6-bisphosphatase class 1 n=1 Tax=Campylobacter portucalensis TaxID=2608384 RepID=A0A6L5WHW1_9BACT|nr:class 1 fructose-bisphosphatase [Campylobacter portucalensis]MSN96032.1 class 1 fructose-bisphosphatase [Campylobacter portucalensis]
MDNILNAIKECAKEISQMLKYCDFGYSNTINKTGDTQLKLDVLSDEIISKKLSKLDNIKALISEEKDEILNLNENAKFIVAYDPLDGSSLVDVNFSVGSIFGIYDSKISPKNLVASLYFVYGPRLEMVFCLDKPYLFRLDENSEFIKIKELKLTQKGKINATGGSQWEWSDTHKSLIQNLFNEKYRLRYSGAMVADLHQILLKGGGLFSYPSTTNAPNGKLRVVFEILPFAYIFEKAGGFTSDGFLDTLFNLEISSIHQTSPCFFGSKFEIQKVRKFYLGEINESN